MKKDLVVLVADVQQEKTLETLLTHRLPALGIRDISFSIFRHPGKDAGVYRGAANFLATFTPPSYGFALVMLDREWDGSPNNADEIRDTLRGQLVDNGWQSDNCQVVVPDPELEAWVWSKSDHVPRILRTDWENIHEVGQKQDCWQTGRLKPHRPKELLEGILQQQKRGRSSAIFQELARNVSLDRCQDTEFLLLRQTLASWFSD